MFIYKGNDKESDKHIENNNLEYKTHQQYKNHLKEIPHFEHVRKQKLKLRTLQIFILLYIKLP